MFVVVVAGSKEGVQNLFAAGGEEAPVPVEAVLAVAEGEGQSPPHPLRRDAVAAAAPPPQQQPALDHLGEGASLPMLQLLRQQPHGPVVAGSDEGAIESCGVGLIASVVAAAAAEALVAAAEAVPVADAAHERREGGKIVAAAAARRYQSCSALVTGDALAPTDRPPSPFSAAVAAAVVAVAAAAGAAGGTPEGTSPQWLGGGRRRGQSVDRLLQVEG